MIGDNIEVRVLSIHGNQVKIGIAAPREIVILREEIIGKHKEKPAPQISYKKPCKIDQLLEEIEIKEAS